MSFPFSFGLDGIADWLFWGIVLLVGLPLLVILLGELAQGLRTTRLVHLKRPLDLFRSSALFLLFTTILLRLVIGLPDTHLIVMIVDTAFWISVLNASLALVNAIIFEGKTDPRNARAPKLLIDLGRVFLVAIGASLIVSYVWKVDLTGLLAALGVGSVVIGLALQDTLGNIFSGVTLLSSNSFRIGSWIKIGDVEGQVRSINWRSLSVATSNGDIVEVPNNQIAKDKLQVLGADRGWCAVSIEIKLHHSYAPERVLAMLREAAALTEPALAEPAPSAALKGYEADGIVYRVTVHVAEFPKAGRARTELMTNLWYVASRAGISLSPAGDAATAATAAPATGSAPVTAPRDIAAELEHFGTFRRPAEALATLAKGAAIQRYRRGEVLMRPGHRSLMSFVLLDGAADALVPGGDETQPAWSYAPGDLILFKAFFRGGTAPLTVRCSSDVEVVMIPVPVLEAALAQDVHLAMQVEQLLDVHEDPRARARLLPAARGLEDGDRVQLLKDLFLH